MSLWRKRNVKHNEQKPAKLFRLSIKSNDLSIKSSKVWVDPPEGWRYGFPAIYDPDTDGQMSEWIVNKGYPVSLIQEYGESWTIRCWPAEEPH
jgi:hypothetical protein